MVAYLAEQHCCSRHQHVQGYLIHLAWAWILLVLQIQFWYVSSRRAGGEAEGELSGYMAFLVFPTLLYLASTLLMPTDVQGTRFSFRDYYYEHATAFFVICGTASLSVTVLGKLFEDRPL